MKTYLYATLSILRHLVRSLQIVASVLHHALAGFSPKQLVHRNIVMPAGQILQRHFEHCSQLGRGQLADQQAVDQFQNLGQGLRSETDQA